MVGGDAQKYDSRSSGMHFSCKYEKILHVVEKGNENDKLCDVSTQNKEMSDAKHEMAGAMQRIVCTVGPLEAKVQRSPARVRF